MLKKLHIRNFKSIKDLKIDPKELNILIGPNNSGKTSVLHSLALLKQTVEIMTLAGRLINLGDFNNVVYKHDSRRVIRISVWLYLTERGRDVIKTLNQSELFEGFRLNRIHCLLTFSRGTRGFPFLWSAKIRDAHGKYIIDFSNDGTMKRPGTFKRLNFNHQGFLPSPRSGGADVIREYRQFETLVSEEFSKFLHYVSSMRGTKHRFEPVDERYSYRPKDVGLFGENTIPVLAYIKDDDRYSAVMERINFWSERFGLKRVVAHIEKGPTYSLKVINKRTRVQSNVLDIGFGVNQLLPVIVQCFYAPRGSLIMIEQPEAHLHPSFQAEIADFLIDVVNYGNRVMVETHSEHLLLRLQRRVAEEKIDPNKINICYFKETPEGSEKSNMKISETGYFVEPIPEGFFEEGFQEALAHLRASYPRRGQIERKE